MILLVSNRNNGKAYNHIIQNLQINGPRILSLEEIETGDYLKYVKEPSKSAIAGGYLARIGCLRVLIEARQDLFLMAIE